MTLPPSSSAAPFPGEDATPNAASAIPSDTGELIAYILERFHAGHRRDLPGLIVLARKVEGAHGARPDAPKGLADHLDDVAEALEEHMQKEEQILFPLIQRGGHPMISHPIAVMRHEHDEHGVNLDKLAALANGFQAPADACGSWRALYEGLGELSAEVREHIRIENTILFPRFGA
jgi:regulator of cell morphogenesis and NO signaling